MLSLADRVRRTIRQHALLPPGSRVVVGLSGGADSVALTMLLAELASDGGFAIARLAHLHHGLRGRAADDDETFCRVLATELAIPIDVEHVDVKALAREGRRSLEDAGREARYRFFDHVADLTGADRIAVGHTQEDQAETLLLNLVRGAGPRGLGGMQPRAGRVVRPLLDVRHADLRQYLAEQGVAFREDETNRDTSLLRNRVRHLVIPFLEQQFSPGVGAVLARNATIARDDAAFLDAEAERAWTRVARPDAAGVVLDCVALEAEPAALARRVALHALEAGSGGRFVGFEHVEALLALAGNTPDMKAADFPRLRAERHGNHVTLTPRHGSGRDGTLTPASADFCYPLSIPGEVRVAEAGVRITAELEPDAGHRIVADQVLEGSDGSIAVVDAEAVAGELKVRSRQPGDRFRPLGLTGTKKLQDFFVDRKVAEAARDRVLIVVDGEDRIVWIAGHAICEDFRVTAGTRAVVILRLERWGDRA